MHFGAGHCPPSPPSSSIPDVIMNVDAGASSEQCDHYRTLSRELGADFCALADRERREGEHERGRDRDQVMRKKKKKKMCQYICLAHFSPYALAAAAAMPSHDSHISLSARSLRARQQKTLTVTERWKRRRRRRWSVTESSSTTTTAGRSVK